MARQKMATMTACRSKRTSKMGHRDKMTVMMQAPWRGQLANTVRSGDGAAVPGQLCRGHGATRHGGPGGRRPHTCPHIDNKTPINCYVVQESPPKFCTELACVSSHKRPPQPTHATQRRGPRRRRRHHHRVLARRKSPIVSTIFSNNLLLLPIHVSIH
jgi:hypothetical protein